MRRVLCLILTCLCVSACSRPADDAPNPGESPAAEMTAEEASSMEASASASIKLSGESAPVISATVPVLKPGLWRVTYQRSEMGFSETRKICVDEALGAKLAEMPAAPEEVTCSRHDVSIDGDAVRVETVCSRNDTTLTSHILIRKPNEDEFHQMMETLYDPASAGHADTHMTADGTFLGACSKPGA